MLQTYKSRWYPSPAQAGWLEQTLETCLAQQKERKGISAFELRRKHPQLLKLPSMWTRSYFAATVGNVSAEIIEKYIAAQKGL
jgi:REP element-mobilizing transposase RayT